MAAGDYSFLRKLGGRYANYLIRGEFGPQIRLNAAVY